MKEQTKESDVEIPFVGLLILVLFIKWTYSVCAFLGF